MNIRELPTESWDPVTGCTRTSAGCDRCYALHGGAPYFLRSFTPTIHPSVLRRPTRWRNPRRVFVSQLGDLFHAEVPPAFVRRVFKTIADTPRHLYQILTKRPQVAAQLADVLPWPNNLWLGVTVESAEYVDRIRTLRSLPAKTRYVAVEPLLGPIRSLPVVGMHWVYVGRETGVGARAMELDWVRGIRDKCVERRVPFAYNGGELDGRTWDGLPSWLDHDRADRQSARSLTGRDQTGV